MNVDWGEGSPVVVRDPSSICMLFLSETSHVEGTSLLCLLTALSQWLLVETAAVSARSFTVTKE